MVAIKVRDLTVQPGDRGQTRIEVCQMAGGYPLTLPLHILHGTRPGPKLLLVAAVHGEEIFAIEVIRQVLRRIELPRLAGSVLAIPVANPPSLEWRTRNTPIDMLNMNRVFPGNKEGWITERLAAAVAEIVEDVDVVIDLDGGNSERVIHYTYVKQAEGAWGRQVEELSRVYGMEYLYSGPFFQGSVSEFAQNLGIPAIVPEVGGSLLFQDSRFLEEAVHGVFNVMRYLGMLDGSPKASTRQFLLVQRRLIRVPRGGIFCPEVGIESLNTPLPKGTLLARVVDPYSLDEVATITSPYHDSILLQMRALLSTVQPGDYAFIIGDGSTAVPIKA